MDGCAITYFMYSLPDGAVANRALPFFSIAKSTDKASGRTLMQIPESGRGQGYVIFCIILLIDPG